MSILLYLPGLLVILFLRQGMRAALDKLVILLVTQTMFAIPFLREDPVAYLRSAFDLGRVFLYKWTVNWRLFSEEIFLSKQLAIALLMGHLSVLGAFGLFKWCERDGGVYHVLSRGFRQPMRPASLGTVTADCECSCLGFMIPPTDAYACRCCDCAFYIQPHWNSFCSLSSLSILLLVCASNPLPGMEDKIPCSCQVG